MSQKPYYETMYILRPDIPEEEVETHVSKYRDLVTEAGAEVLDTQMRGKRREAGLECGVTCVRLPRDFIHVKLAIDLDLH